MSDRYEGLGLDQILEITAADAAHSGDLHRQGMGLQALSDKLNQSLDSMVNSRNGIETGFKGVAGQAVFDQVTDLMRRGSKGHTRLSGQPDTFFRLSAETRANHARMLELHDERDRELAAALPEERPRIWRQYDQDARQFMRLATAGYVDSVKSLEPTGAYDGPRLPRTEDVGGPEGIVDHTTPGPHIGGGHYKDLLPGVAHHGSLGDGGPELQNMTATATESVAQNNPVQSARPQTTTGIGTFGMGGPKGVGGKGSKRNKKKRRKDDAKSGFTFETSKPVTPPVIGAREAGPDAASGPSGPAHRPDGLLPPVIGARPTPMWAPGAVGSGAGGPAARPAEPVAAPPRNQAPTKTFGNDGAGVRSVARLHPAEGRVFRGGSTTPKRPAAPEFTRQPRITHGDGDNLNRAVVRNSRALTPEPAAEPASEPAPAPKPAEQSSDSQWRTARPVVAAVIRGRRPAEVAAEEQEHDPGPFLTHYNLGRNA